ncbi:hypothetical protein IEQ_04858 [Bacillus cereus BAG6X1-2]|nr:hypothetical protein IEQ_04858 [Bacillus cereus BAG6X1-2]
MEDLLFELDNVEELEDIESTGWVLAGSNWVIGGW